jgi:uncharacterized protein YciU (UPF0263 family)
MHQYRRRTWDEACEMARSRFRNEVASHFSQTESDQFRQIYDENEKMILGGGLVLEPDSWRQLTDTIIDRDHFYEISIYEVAPYDGAPSPKIWMRALVSRDRESDLCVIDWHPIQDAQIQA